MQRVAVLLLALPSASAVWVVGDDAQTCADVCAGTCREGSSLKTPAEFNEVLAQIFPAGCDACKAAQRGTVSYDPSISDGYCGWETSGETFDCGASVPEGTNRLCPCGPPAQVSEAVKEKNCKRVNLAAYNKWKSKPVTPSPTPAPAITPTPTIMRTPAPTIIRTPAPTASRTPAPTIASPYDTDIAGSGDDYYTIFNLASQRSLYASKKGVDASDGTDTIGVGASTDTTSAPSHGWRVVAAGKKDGRPLFKLVNDQSKRRLYVRSGSEIGATNADAEASGETWFLEEIHGDGTETRFNIVSADSGCYLFAGVGNDMVSCGATADGSAEWGMRVQSNELVDGSTIQLYHHSGARGTAGTAAYCEVKDIIYNVQCSTEDEEASDAAMFVVDFIDASIPSFSLKSVSTGQYCTGNAAVTCTADDVKELQTFTMVKSDEGSLQVKSGDNTCVPGLTAISCLAIPPANSGYFEARCKKDCARVMTIEANGMYDSTLLGPASTGAAVGLFLGAATAVLGAMATVVYRRLQNVNRASEVSTEDGQLLTE